MNLGRLRTYVGAVQARTTLVSAAIVVAVLLIPSVLPHAGVGTYALGLAFGAGTGLAVMGVVLVYQSSRVINFAQVQMGAVSATLFSELVRHHYLVFFVYGVCPECLGNRWLRPAEYWVSAFLSLLAAPLVGLLVFLVLRLLRGAPRYVSTVATLALGTALTAAAASLLPALFDPQRGGGALLNSANLTPPVVMHLAVGGVLLDFGQVLAIAAALVALLLVVAFLRFTRAGRAVRATAEDRERAASLGINEAMVQAQVWLLAGTLAGLAAILQGMAAGGTTGGSATAGLMVRVLVAAILAGMESVPLALAAAFALSCLDQAFFAGFQNTSLVDGALFVIVLVALLLRPRGAPSRYDPDAAVWRVVREVRPTPPQLRNVLPVKRARRALVAAIVVVLVALPLVSAPGDLEGITTLAIYGMVGLSLLLVAGWAGQISLGQFGFVGVGAWVAAVLAANLNWPMPIAVLGAALAGAAVAVIVGLPSLRIRGLYLAVTSLAFAVAVASLLISPSLGGRLLPDRLDRPALLGLDLEDERVFYYLCVIITLLVVGAVLGMRRSRTGRAVIAGRDNERASQALGIAPLLAKVEIFAVSGFIAALAGALFAFEQHGVRAGSFSAEVSERMFMMVIVGGLGAVSGPLLGSLYLGALPILSAVGTAGPDVGAAVVLVLILALSPGGLTQLVFAARDAFLRRVADRHHIDVPSLVGRRLGVTERMPIAPKLLRGGGTAFVPIRYRVPGLPRIRKVAFIEPRARR